MKETYDGSYLTNRLITLPNGGQFNEKLTRRVGRRNLVARRDHTFNEQSVYWNATEFDVLGRPTNAVDSVSMLREWIYNNRNEYGNLIEQCGAMANTFHHKFSTKYQDSETTHYYYGRRFYIPTVKEGYDNVRRSLMLQLAKEIKSAKGGK